MMTINELPDREFVHNGNAYLYFGGTSYLGLQNLDKFQNILIQNIKKYGTCYSSSRKSNIQLAIYKKAESYLAQKIGCESSVCLSSGLLSGKLVSNLFNTDLYKTFYAPNTHIALHTEASINELSTDILVNKIKDHLNSGQEQIPVLFMDSVSFDGNNYPDFTWLNEIPPKEVILVVDDSHAFGLIGEYGFGSYSLLKKMNPKELVVCGSLGKGFGTQAGIISGNTSTIERIKSNPIYGGASPTAPAFMATLIDSEEIYHEQRSKLRQNIDLFLKLLYKKDRFCYMQNHPVFSYSNPELTTHLESNNVIVTNFHYPNENSPLISKIVLSAYHKKKDIELLVKLINAL